jgi:Domain of unknown function (DUF5134)
MSMSGPSGPSATHGVSPATGTNILPTWLAVLWALVMIGVFAVHFRHARESSGQRRIWHSGHVLMALGMAFMFAPGSIDPVHIAPRVWQLAFATAAVLILAGILAALVNRWSVNALWPLAAIDMAVMAYMWSTASRATDLTWLLAASFAGASALWLGDRMRAVDRRFIVGAYAITPDGALGAAAAEPLICDRKLRVSMAAMALGMSYMLAAMALAA